MSSDALHLLHTRPDVRRLSAWAARHGLLDGHGDLGYALHALLHAAFGEQAPRPFRYLDAERGLLAYSRLDPARLAQCTALADPEVAAALGLGQTLRDAGMQVRVFPSDWPSGHTLGFAVRVRPVIREGKTGRERDAFLSAVEKSRDTHWTRDTVYADWLRACLMRQGGAELLHARVTHFQLLGVTRKSKKLANTETRQHRLVIGPDVVLEGLLRVHNPLAFAQLLTDGVGRHRAFGFGMLLLRSAQP